jgi:hypothetical protein
LNSPECPVNPPPRKLPDLAKHLSKLSGKEVTEERILELILNDKEDKFTLSVILPNNTMATCCREVQYNKNDLDDDIAKRTFPDQLIRKNLSNGKREQLKTSIIDSHNNGLQLGDDAFITPAYSEHWFYLDQLEESMLVMAIEGLQIGADRYLIEDEYESALTGIWDLPMIGNEWIEVKRVYHNLTGGPTVSKVQAGRWTGGVCLKGQDGRIFKLQRTRDDIECQDDYLLVSLEKLKNQIASFNVEDYLKEDYYQDVERRMKVWTEYFAIEASQKEKYYPMDYLPEGSVLVVREAVVRVFEVFFGGAVQKLSNTHSNQSNDLQVLIEASSLFWERALPEERDTQPTNAMVSNWLIDERGFSKRNADVAATIIRPKWAGNGRKPNKNSN